MSHITRGEGIISEERRQAEIKSVDVLCERAALSCVDSAVPQCMLLVLDDVTDGAKAFFGGFPAPASFLYGKVVR